MKNEAEIWKRLAGIEERLAELERHQLKKRELASNRRLKKLQRPQHAGGR